MKYVLVLDVDPKEDDSGVRPDMSEVRKRVGDVLRDVTKHDETIGWMVVAVHSFDASLKAEGFISGY